MSVGKKLRLAYLLFLLVVTAAAVLWGLPIYRYLKAPIAPAHYEAAERSASSDKSAGEGLDLSAPRAMDPRALLGVNAATLPKFEGMVERLAPRSSQAWVGLGILYQFKELPAEAERCYLKALEMEPDMADAHYRLSTVYHAAGDFDKAIAENSTTLRLRGGYLPAYYGLAAAYQEQGRGPDAVRVYLEILRIDPDEYQAHNNLAILYEQRGDVKEALKEYAKAAQLNPHDPLVKQNFEAAQKDFEAGRSLRYLSSQEAAVPVREAPVPSQEPPAPLPPPRPEFKPEKVSTVFLRNKRTMSGEVLSRDDGGLWFRIDEGTEVYLSNEEVERVE